jgi:hypothetical protein
MRTSLLTIALTLGIATAAPIAVSMDREAAPTRGDVVPVSGADRLTAPLGVDPACAPKVELGMRNDGRTATYADMFITVDPPLTASRPMLTSYLPPGYQLGAKVLLTIPPDTPVGDYQLQLDAQGNKLSVPMTVVALDDLDTGGNLALRRPVTASSTVTSGNYPACSVVDGDATSDDWAGGNGWNDGTSRTWPDTIDIDLGGPQQVDRVDLHTLNTERYPASSYGVRDWDVQVRVDGQWQTVASVRGNTAGTVRSDFAAVTGDAIRISTLASNGNNDYSRITEIQAFGPS